MSAIDEIAAERRRQIETEGWDPQHDDAHNTGALCAAGACYAISAFGGANDHELIERLWPWTAAWWKPTTPRRDLIKAAALIVAEIERVDRLGPNVEAIPHEGMK